MTSKKFVLGIMFSILVLILVNKSIYYILTNPNNLYLKPTTSDLVIGASQGRLGINPDYFERLENICVLGEINLLTKKKLNLILNRQNSIKRVMLPLSPVTFTYNREYQKFQELLLEPDLMYEYLFKDDSIAEYSNIDFFVDKRRNKYKLGITPPSSEEWLAFFNHCVKGEPLPKVHPTWGRYEASFKSNNLNIDYSLKRLFYLNSEISGYSPLQVKYFDEIIDLCLNKNIQLILIGMPSAQEFRKRTPDFHKNFLDSLVSSRINKFPSINYLDYLDLEVPNSFFDDAFHLNHKGSNFFSNILSNQL